MAAHSNSPGIHYGSHDEPDIMLLNSTFISITKRNKCKKNVQKITPEMIASQCRSTIVLRSTDTLWLMINYFRVIFISLVIRKQCVYLAMALLLALMYNVPWQCACIVPNQPQSCATAQSTQHTAHTILGYAQQIHAFCSSQFPLYLTTRIVNHYVAELMCVVLTAR